MPLVEARLASMQPLSEAELQSIVISLIGRLVMELSRFELNLDLCLRHLVGGSEPVLLNPLIERLSLKAKMDALREVVARRHAGDADCLREFNAWYAVMDRIRAKRNAFIHGGWVFNYYEQEVTNLAPGLPGFDHAQGSPLQPAGLGAGADRYGSGRAGLYRVAAAVGILRAGRMTELLAGAASRGGR